MENISNALLNEGKKILLVDDEKPVLDVTEQILKRCGYKITPCSSGKEAIDHFQTFPHEFDLVITDMTMPNIDGDKLAAKIKSIRPEIPVILWTGQNQKETIEKTNNFIPDKILMKPSGKDKMLKTIRLLLNE